ncbi:Fe(3+) dicitrate ABC transporter permease subunit FecD [Erwinia persicina]|uniref:Fe(3+) dicitrate ABC transporter permease subunit FecD n=1 Tax=Erwinia persicina TaxID=55211 RepID=A0A4U3F8M4_9GAMM|nr:Fe(3+) dicitrate ABC transporter permease subunit FecD [Erwinia persicina]MBC3945177.1 Fe(3+) dicitrate ABC transporter permease subunit FecD [Erwinia persicina]MBD8107209.1 Fe(3+) dicitrate ABC transporter permease subunit FecD [Erwinia persicina]MBD8167786.1 Fe(3+) dicitrate ABC transporter permease subunit FecD [Erwinia persicina]MBD8210289.1 Fe(3+) dicitrate ABC transporter permease subunit FecD [Erwinia persicina]MCQ4094916.1 Fe(3+) dicitrate ABC transporter permease subunit FecD [Erwi
MRSPRLMLSLLLALVLLALVLSLRYGSETLSFSALRQALDPADSRHFALMEYRLPRTLLALLVGAALAVSGVLVQGVIRNPLASPEILGVNHAAGLCSVSALMLFPALPVLWLPLLAFAGGLLAFVLLRRLAGHSAPLRLALLGVALTALYASVTDYLMLSRPLEINQALLWLTGSLWGRGWPFVWVALPWLLLLIPLSLLLCRDLDLLALGEEQAHTLGVALPATPHRALLLAVALAAVSVALCGPLSFIGLVAPHLTRRLIGGRHHWLLPASMLVGALLLLLADLLARTLHPPLELPAGVLTAIIGAPYFFWLLMRTR